MKCKDCDNWKCLDRSYGEAECVHYKCDGQSSFSQQSSLQSFDWQPFRNQAAKDILCSMIQGGYDYSRTKSQSELAIKYADELIRQLKEMEEK